MGNTNLLSPGRTNRDEQAMSGHYGLGAWRFKGAWLTSAGFQ